MAAQALRVNVAPGSRTWQHMPTLQVAAQVLLEHTLQQCAKLAAYPPQPTAAAAAGTSATAAGAAGRCSNAPLQQSQPLPLRLVSYSTDLIISPDLLRLLAQTALQEMRLLSSDTPTEALWHELGRM